MVILVQVAVEYGVLESRGGLQNSFQNLVDWAGKAITPERIAIAFGALILLYLVSKIF